jgi:hypothetical protein
MPQGDATGGQGQAASRLVLNLPPTQDGRVGQYAHFVTLAFSPVPTAQPQVFRASGLVGMGKVPSSTHSWNKLP